MSEKLLPCPFCGNTNIVLKDNGIGDVYAVCDGDDESVWCGARSSDHNCETDAKAIRRWNTRSDLHHAAKVNTEVAERPTAPGWYWAKWRSAAPGTREGAELTPCDDWCAVEVWENYLPPDDGDGEFLGVSVTGVDTTQWLENFDWGPRIADLRPDAPPCLALSILAQEPAEPSEATMTEREKEDLQLWLLHGRLGHPYANEVERARRIEASVHPAVPAGIASPGVTDEPVAWRLTWPDGANSYHSGSSRPKSVRGITLTPLYSHPTVKVSGDAAEWQPIETAPRDGTSILATGGGLEGKIEVVFYIERVGAWETAQYTLDDTDDEPQGYNRPTHWMSLPATPAQSERDSKTGGAA